VGNDGGVASRGAFANALVRISNTWARRFGRWIWPFFIQHSGILGRLRAVAEVAGFSSRSGAGGDFCGRAGGLKRHPWLATGWFWYIGTLSRSSVLCKWAGKDGGSLHVYSTDRGFSMRGLGGRGFSGPLAPGRFTLVTAGVWPPQPAWLHQNQVKYWRNDRALSSISGGNREQPGGSLQSRPVSLHSYPHCRLCVRSKLRGGRRITPRYILRQQGNQSSQARL